MAATRKSSASKKSSAKKSGAKKAGTRRKSAAKKSPSKRKYSPAASSQVGDELARDEAWPAEVGPLGQKGNGSQTSDRNRFVRSAAQRQKGRRRTLIAKGRLTPEWRCRAREPGGRCGGCRAPLRQRRFAGNPSPQTRHIVRLTSTPQGGPSAIRRKWREFERSRFHPHMQTSGFVSRADGHLQATGRDARGRKQYRYHQRWGEIRGETKFERMLEFAERLPRIRASVERDLALPGLPREKVLAAAVSLLEATSIRIGNEEYARSNDSFGITTLRENTSRFAARTCAFAFAGRAVKSTRSRSTIGVWRASCSACKICRGRSSSRTSTMTANRTRSIPATSTTTSGAPAMGSLPRRISVRGSAPWDAPKRCSRPVPAAIRKSAKRPSPPRSSGLQKGSEIRPPSAAKPTCTRG